MAKGPVGESSVSRSAIGDRRGSARPRTPAVRVRSRRRGRLAHAAPSESRERAVAKSTRAASRPALACRSSAAPQVHRDARCDPCCGAQSTGCCAASPRRWPIPARFAPHCCQASLRSWPSWDRPRAQSPHRRRCPHVAVHGIARGRGRKIRYCGTLAVAPQASLAWACGGASRSEAGSPVARARRPM